MLLSTYIKNLQDALNEHGDIPVAYASDDEGNSYQGVQFEPTLFFVDKNKADDHYLELYQEDEVNEYVSKKNKQKILVIN